MATVVVPTKPPGVTQDDEEWLYGDSQPPEPAAPGTGPEEVLPPPGENTENVEGTTQPQETKDDDDDSDDDDDDVQVTIGDIQAFPVTGTGGTLFKPGGSYQKQPVVAGAAQKAGAGTQVAKGVDVDGEGTVNGINLYEFSLDTLRDEDKPWRKPGADITDYFNYGFNEESWRKYCQRQNRLRAENGVVTPKPFTHNTGYTPHTHVKVESDHSTSSGHSHNNYIHKPYVPAVQQTTAIAVLGSTTASRRPAEESMDDVQQIGTLSSDLEKTPTGPPPGMPPMGMPPPNYSVPPPGMPNMPPPGFSPAVPPPGMNVPPPNMYGPPPVPPYFPPHSHLPPPAANSSFNEHTPYSYENTPKTSSYTESQSSWDRDRDRERDSYRERDRDRDRDRDSNSDGSDDYRYRDYDSRQADSRDYYRSRDSDRSRSDRDRSRSRERERRYRDRDRDDKKSKRKIKDEPSDDSEYYKSSSSSKHKKSKRSKRDKDDDADKPDDPAS